MGGDDTDGRTEPDAGAILASIGAAAYEWDLESDRIAWGGDVEGLLRTPGASLASGRLYARRIDPEGPPGRHAAVVESGVEDEGAGIAYHIEYRFLPLGGGEALWIEDNGRWFAGPDGKPVRAHGIIRAINERRARDERLIYRSDHDNLTGALNRARLVEEIGAAIVAAERFRRSAAVAIVAVDNLSVLNDAYGFDVADEVIAGVARRVRREMRGGDSIGRLAGNKLGLVLNDCSEADFRIAVDRLARAVASGPIATGTGQVAVTVSVGGVVVPRHGRTAHEALGHAQEALDEARLRGSASVAVYEPSPVRDAARRRNAEVAGQVVAALNEGRLGLALQPVVRTATRVPAFHEALCRLHLPDGTVIAAGEFIETAERLGIVRLIDHRAVDLAIAELRADPDLVLSINVSTSSALDGTWFARLVGQIRRDRSLARRLIVEITETMAITDLQRAVQFVQSVRDIGCRVAIDDFGAGHTSFRNLRALRVDIVKIDGCFIEGIADNEADRFFVATLVSLARHVGLEVVAERVSCEADAAVLAAIGVDYLQGRMFGIERAGDPSGEIRIAAG
jgi:diguanylate cyclase (GGDEF)-like protein